MVLFSADNLCKQFGPRSDPTNCCPQSGSNLFDTQMVFLEAFLEKSDFKENQQTINRKKHEKFPRGQRVKNIKMSLKVSKKSIKNKTIKKLISIKLLKRGSKTVFISRDQTRSLTW